MTMSDIGHAALAAKSTVEIVFGRNLVFLVVVSFMLLTMPLVLHTGRALDVNFAWDATRYPGWTDVVRLVMGYFLYALCAGNVFLGWVVFRSVIKWGGFALHVWRVIFESRRNREMREARFRRCEASAE